MRREIEEALAIKRNIVPLMLEGFDFGTPAIANQLTGKLAALKKYNALDVPASYFMEAMERLREQISECATGRSAAPGIPFCATSYKEANKRRLILLQRFEKKN